MKRSEQGHATSPRFSHRRKTAILAVQLVCYVSLAGIALIRAQTNAQPQRQPNQEPPTTWVDPITGHRVTRLSTDPNSESFYFNVNAYTPDGLDMIYISPRGLYDLNLSTMQSIKIVAGSLDDIIVGTKTRRVFFRKHGSLYIYVVDIDSQKITQLGMIPLRGVLSSVNADETLIAVATSTETTRHSGITRAR